MTLIQDFAVPSKDSLLELFKNMPEALQSQCRTMTLEKGSALVSMGNDCGEVYLLLHGKLQIVRYDFSGNLYVYAYFKAPEFIGELEVMADVKTYRSTVIAVTPCTCLAMSAEVFLQWMKADHHALLLRARATTRLMLFQTTQERSHQFLSSTDRLILHLVQYYEEHADQSGGCLMHQQLDMAQETGYSIKTIHRKIDELRQKGLITKQGKRVYVSLEQYKKLSEQIHPIMFERS